MNSSDIAIKVENMSKRYRIGLKEETNDSFAAAVLNFVKSPLKNYQKYRSIYKFDDVGLDGGNNSSDTIWALRDVSFELKKGEVLGIIGRNGAGKSTLLKILSRITDPTVGKAEISGRISSLLEVGTGFHPELTGRENIYLNGTILGMRKQEVKLKFDDIVEFSGIKKFIDTPVKRYSSGMKVRLAFSVASHLEPEVLLIDEVLAVGDADFQKKCLNKMENVGQKGRTVLFVSHNMAAIENLCSRVIWIDNGQIKQDGQAFEVIESYMSSFVQTEKKGYNLRNTKTREGSGEIRYDEIELLTTDGQPQEILRSGDSVVVRIHYHAKEIIKTPYFVIKNLYRNRRSSNLYRELESRDSDTGHTTW